MRTKSKGIAMVIAISVLVALPAWGEELSSDGNEIPPVSAGDPAEDRTEGETPSKSEENTDPPAGAAPIWVPRDAGAPVTRVGGATRSVEMTKLPAVRALVPEQVGYTLSGQPVLYWHLSENTEYRVEFTLVSGDASVPLVEQTIPGPLERGIQRIELSSFGVTLELGVSYMWYVSLVLEPERRSADRVAGGGIERIETPSVLKSRLEEAAPEEYASVLAAEGIWYDALASLSERSTSDAGARTQRAALLEQAGLAAIHK